MSSKRKANGAKSVQRVVLAINKIGCEVHDFFRHVERVVDVPLGFHPAKEAIRFNLFRTEGVAEHPDYQIPACVLEFAGMIHSATCPKKFYADLQSRVRMNAQQSARAMMSGAAPVMRPAPAYS
jgi:hypothetical protein